MGDKDRVIANLRAEWEQGRDRLRRGEDEREEMVELRRELQSRKDELQELQNELEHERMVRERERIAQEQAAEMDREEREREREERQRAEQRAERERKEREEAMEADVRQLNSKLRQGAKKYKQTLSDYEAMKERADRAEAERAELAARAKELEAAVSAERDQASEEQLRSETRHGERYERLLREYRQYKDVQQKMADEQADRLKEANERISKMEDEMQSGQPQGQQPSTPSALSTSGCSSTGLTLSPACLSLWSERRILELAELQARREDAVRKAETEAASLRQQLQELRRRAKALKDENELLQAQQSEDGRSQSRSQVNIDYLKSVLVRFLAFDPQHPQRRALVPVIATILQFSPEELRAVETVRPQTAGWLSMLGMATDGSAAAAANTAAASQSSAPPASASTPRRSVGRASGTPRRIPASPASAASSSSATSSALATVDTGVGTGLNGRAAAAGVK